MSALTLQACRCAAGAGAARPAGGVAGRPLRALAADPDRPAHRGGRGRAQLSGALPQEGRALHRAGAPRPRARRVRASRSRRSTTFAAGRKSLGLVGYEGVRHDRRLGARHGGLGRARQGGGPAALRSFSAARSAPVPAYNSNGLWLTELGSARQGGRASCVAEGGFAGLKLRLGRERIARRPRGDRGGPRGARRRHAS